MADTLKILAPASKSATQRALLIAAMAEGISTLRHPLDCDDSRGLVSALTKLGMKISTESGEWTVDGGSLHPSDLPLNCRNAGSTFRFLSALSLLLRESTLLEVGEQLSLRPMHDVHDSLLGLGAEVICTGEPGYPPFRITPPQNIPRRVTINASRTSQFLSGLLMVAPRLGGLEIETGTGLISRPYVDMTLAAMRQFGFDGINEESDKFLIERGFYTPTELQIEGDWSAGAMLHVAGWLTGIDLVVPNLKPQSTQGDRQILPFLSELNENHPHRFDLHTCPDLITPLAVACAFADQPSEIVNVGHARIKESDRIAASAQLLNTIGIRVEERADGLLISPGGRKSGALIEDHDDHRVAMAAGLVSLRVPGVKTMNPGCVSKSYPGFWDDLEVFKCI